MVRFAIAFVSFAVLAFLIFGCIGAPSADNARKQNESEAPFPSAQAHTLSKQAPPVQEPAITSPAQQAKPEVMQTPNSLAKTRDGYVNLDEIGGENLTVVSFFKLSSLVSANGSFATKVSSRGAQLVMVVDKNRTVRASAVSLPDDKLLVFDAKSTTKASMWAGGSATQEEGTAALAIMETLKCYPGMYAYMKTNLKQKPLAQIANVSNSEYAGLEFQCANEIAELTKAKMPD
ncbi:MAG: hypothetical protein NT051_03080 [Candidatus Micrarchaeota archaeon]|nr:hypothetical protein [Candidatus Micrarchaeota archaeon]